jgi:hypothetical protein
VGPAGGLEQRERFLGVEAALLGSSGIGGDLRAVRERERSTDRRLQLEQPFDALMHSGGRAREVTAPALEPDSGVLRPGEPVLGPALAPSRATGHQHRARLLEAGRPQVQEARDQRGLELRAHGLVWVTQLEGTPQLLVIEPQAEAEVDHDRGGQRLRQQRTIVELIGAGER